MFFNNKEADCQKIWRLHGWTPPTEYRTDYLFLHRWGTKLDGTPKRKLDLKERDHELPSEHTGRGFPVCNRGD